MKGKLGRVYKIYSNQTRVIYIGITFDTLKNEWKRIIDNYNNRKRVSYSRFELLGIYPFFKIYGVENFHIELLGEYDVYDLLHLHAYGQLWINKLNVNCCNELVYFNPRVHLVYTRKRFYLHKYNKKWKLFKKLIQQTYYKIVCLYTP